MRPHRAVTRWLRSAALVLGSALAAGSLAAQTPAAAPASLGGTIRDVAGRPVVAAEVLINGERRTRSDSTGRYQIDSIGAGEITLLVRRFGYGPAQARLQLAPGARRSLHVELLPATQALAPVVVTGTGQGLVGAVRDTLGAPLRDVEIAIIGAATAARTDASGRFRLTDLPAGPYIVVARHVGYRGARFALEMPATGSREVSIELAPLPPGLSDAAARAESGVSRSGLSAERDLEHRLRLGAANSATVVTRAALDSSGLGTLHTYLADRGLIGGAMHLARPLTGIPSAGGNPNGGREAVAAAGAVGPCLFLDGELAPAGLSTSSIRLEDLELLEVLPEDRTMTLGRQAEWAAPPRACSVFVVAWFRR